MKALLLITLLALSSCSTAPLSKERQEEIKQEILLKRRQAQGIGQDR
jgi:starvation-inducible outer membrane lipoprotein